jgi:hypothetical protein
VTENGLKWSKKQKIRREVRENESLNIRSWKTDQKGNMDCGQLRKWKKTSTSALEHLTERRKDRLAKP